MNDTYSCIRAIRGSFSRIVLCAVLSLPAVVSVANPAEIIRLADAPPPSGIEADGIAGDYVLRNGRISVLVADAKPDRRAHMTVGHSSGMILDAAPEGAAVDRLTCLHLGVHEWPVTRASLQREADGSAVLSLTGDAAGGTLRVTHLYRLAPSAHRVRIVTTVANTGAAAVLNIEAADRVRWEGMSVGPRGERAFAYAWHEDGPVAYALAPASGGVRIDAEERPNWGTTVHYPAFTARTPGQLQPGESLTWERDFVVGRDAAEVLAETAKRDGLMLAELEGQVTEPSGDGGARPAACVLILNRFGRPVEEALRVPVGPDGRFALALPVDRWRFEAETVGRRMPIAVTRDLAAEPVRDRAPLDFRLPPPARVAFDVTENGRPVPCKVRFTGIDGTPTPDLGPRVRAHGSENLYFSENGRFTQELAPGAYRIGISRGPEYHVVERKIRLEAGETARMTAALERAVDTAGWIAADLHSHTTESGDNITPLPDRLINHAAEGMEFIPATDHNRIVDWSPAIAALGLAPWLKSVPGIEMTGASFHYNAFPLEGRPGTQDNGAPRHTPDPIEAARRLREFPPRGADKYVQLNHPGMDRAFNDRDLDGEPDGGYPGTEKAFDGVELYEWSILEMRRYLERSEPKVRVHNRALHWLQYLNQGHRYAAVATSDAHDTAYGSGYPRIYIPSSTDDPSKIDPAEMIRNLKAMRVLMTNAPFMTVSIGGQEPGGTVTLKAGESRVPARVRVQCAKGYDVDRVQALVNGRPEPAYNFRREDGHPWFRREGPVRFEGEFEVAVPADAHVIVVATGESSDIVRIAGDRHRGERPTAISNPVFIDVGGDGFTPNRDTLGHPLPVALPR